MDHLQMYILRSGFEIWVHLCFSVLTLLPSFQLSASTTLLCKQKPKN